MTTACINNLAVQELNSKAVKYMDNGDSETAICRLKSSLDLDNEIYQTHYNLAVAYNNVGQYEEAIVELNKVLELKPDFYDAIYTLAVAKEAIAFKIFENEYGTYFYASKYYNALDLLDLDNVLYFWYNPVFLDDEEILDVVINNDVSNIDNDSLFLDKATTYRIGD